MCVVWFSQDGSSFLDCAACPRESLLINWKLRATGVDGGHESIDGEIGELLGDGLESDADVVEFSGHAQMMTHQV